MSEALFPLAAFTVQPDQDPDYEAQAREWMKDNPEAMSLFESLALQAAKKGRKFGVKFLAERVRWEFAMARTHQDFSINNNFTAYIARHLVKRHPRLGQFLEFRTIRKRAA